MNTTVLLISACILLVAVIKGLFDTYRANNIMKKWLDEVNKSLDAELKKAQERTKKAKEAYEKCNGCNCSKCDSSNDDCNKPCKE